MPYFTNFPAGAIGDTPGAAFAAGSTNMWRSYEAARAAEQDARNAALAAQAQANERWKYVSDSQLRNRDWAQNQEQNRFTNARASVSDARVAEQDRFSNMLSRDTLELNRDRFSLEERKSQAETGTQFRERQLALKNALDDAIQGLFADIGAVAATYPTLTPQEHATVLRQSLETRRKLGEQDTEAANMAGTLNAPSRFTKMLPEILSGKVSGELAGRWGLPTQARNWTPEMVAADVAPLVADPAKAKTRFPELGPLYAQQAEAVTRAGELRDAKTGQPPAAAQWNSQLGQYVPTQRLQPPVSGTPVARPFDAPVAAIPLPASKSELRAGQLYMTRAGIVVFDGTKFTEVK